MRTLTTARFARLPLSLLTLTLSLALAPSSARAQETKPDAKATATAPVPEDWDSLDLQFKLEPNVPIEIDAVLQLVAARLKVPFFGDPQIMGQKLRLSDFPGTITWGTLKQVLDFYDVVPQVRTDDLGHKALFAHLRRNLATSSGPPCPVIGSGEAGQHKGEVVTAFVQIQNGAGNDIFSVVRGLLVRDINRIGNILYVRGPEMMIVQDFGENVQYYTKVIKSLDVAAPRQTIRVFPMSRGSAVDAGSALEKLFPGTKFIPSPRTNQLMVQTFSPEMAQIEALVGELDGPTSALAPAPKVEAQARSDGAGSVIWPLAAVCATIAFLGQTMILRRMQVRLGLRKV